MPTINTSLPGNLKQIVDLQVAMKKTILTLCQLISRDQERDQLRNLLLQGAQSVPSGLADEAYFVELRSGINSR